MWGTLKWEPSAWFLPAKSKRITLPGNKAKPGVISVPAGASKRTSVLLSNNICSPTQTPNIGLVRLASKTASNKPDSCKCDMQSGMAPCPGKTTLSAALISSTFEEIITFASGAACINAWATERKLPIP